MRLQADLQRLSPVVRALRKREFSESAKCMHAKKAFMLHVHACMQEKVLSRSVSPFFRGFPQEFHDFLLF
jgi:hypothetical protein